MFSMKIDFNEFLRIMSCILIILLIVQGLDYIVGIGVNNYLFIIFCITFAFTMGSIYHNILNERKRKERLEYEKTITEKLEIVQDLINQDFEVNGLTDEVIKSQMALNHLREELNLEDDKDFTTEKGSSVSE